jgi:hypothetical protein
MTERLLSDTDDAQPTEFIGYTPYKTAISFSARFEEMLRQHLAGTGYVG